ncbi:MAG: nuclear transport factor 2 family protein, partial [Planctomycetota bacterium]|nr:nuclear transport factor 2 family protein [Planctomycetota bacterium]
GTTAEVAKRFHTLAFDTVREGDWADTIATMFAPDAVFSDPTTAEYGMGLAAGIHGRDNIIRTMQSFGLKDHAMDITTSFACGEYAVLFGDFSYAAPPSMTGAKGTVHASCPFTTILHVQNGLIAERRDYADYWELTRVTNRQIPGADVTANDAKEVNLRRQAEDYLAHYAACDWDALEALWSPETTFQDPTGAVFGAGQLFVGPPSIRAHFEEVLATIQENGGLKFTPIRSFVTGSQAIYLQRIAWPTRADQLGIPDAGPTDLVTLSADVLIVLEFKDDKVVRHRDYASYESLSAQIAAHRRDATQG